MMNPFTRIVRGLGNQTAPFGFAPNDPDAATRAGWGVISDIGANLAANNQGGVDALSNLGASLQQAKTQGMERNRQQFTAQQLMEEAALRKQKRETEEADRKRREDYIKTLPPDVQMKAMSIPGYLDSWISANDPSLQRPQEPKLYNVGGALVDAGGNVIYKGEDGGLGSGNSELGLNLVPLQDKDGNFAGWGQPSKGGGIVPAPVQGADGVVPMSPYDRKLNERAGTKEGDAIGEARGDLPGAEKQAQITNEKVAELEDNPALDAAIGWTTYLPDMAVNSSVIDVRAKVDELMGGAFLEARTMLKGGGQITDYEGQRAERAYARMERAIKASDPKVFREALRDFTEAVNDGVDKLRATARRSAQPAGQDDPLELRK